MFTWRQRYKEKEKKRLERLQETKREAEQNLEKEKERMFHTSCPIAKNTPITIENAPKKRRIEETVGVIPMTL